MRTQQTQPDPPLPPPAGLANSQEPKQEPKTASVLAVFVGLLICLTVAGLLSSARLVAIAERQEFGGSRQSWIGAAEGVDDLATAMRLDRPATFVADLLDAQNPDTVAEVVLGDLALPSVTTASTHKIDDPTDTPTTTPTLSTTTTMPTPTTTQALRTVSPSKPLLVWAGGDSLGEYVGSRLQYRIIDTDLAQVALDYHISTGITRPDYFDWPVELSSVMDAEGDPSMRPEALIFMAGGNDDQPMMNGERKLLTNSPAWLREYRHRVAVMMDITAYEGVRFYWVGLPPMREPRREQIATNINDILAEEASKREWVTFLDIRPLLLNEDGVYDQYIVGPDGEPHKARERDGVHVTSQASQWISALLWELIQQDWAIVDPSAGEPWRD